MNAQRESGLHRVLIRKVRAVLRDLQGHGWKPLIAEGLRTLEQQRAKVQAGYSKTMNSKHLKQADGYGHAADIVDARYLWNDNSFFYKLFRCPTCKVPGFRDHLGSSARAHNLRWGGTWKSYGKYGDWAHVELKPEDA